MKILVNTIIVLFLVIAGGCSSTEIKQVSPATAVPDAMAAQNMIAKNKLQFQTLGFIFYEDNPMPAEPTTAELDAAKQLADGPDKKQLQNTFGDDLNLWAYAMRDTNDNGIRDYRFDEYHGRFMEGDVDIDGDDIRNTLDLEPYDASIKNDDSANNNGVPDHLDWALQDKPEHMSVIQQKLFNDHGIILVERSTEFTALLAQGVYDIITRAFKPLFEGRQTLPTLTTVAAIKWTSLDLPTDDFSRAQVTAHNGTLEMFAHGINLSRFLLIGVLGHELSHNIQFAMDYSDTDRSEIIKNIYRNKNFHNMMEQFGWQIDEIPVDESKVFQHISPQYQEVKTYKTIRFEQKTYKQWIDAIGKKDLRHPMIRITSIVGNYSLSSPFEWHADYMIAYLFIGMQNYAAQHFCTAEEAAKLKELAIAENITTWKFNHDNARGNKKALAFFRDKHHIDEADWEYFTQEYLLKNYPGICSKGP